MADARVSFTIDLWGERQPRPRCGGQPLSGGDDLGGAVEATLDGGDGALRRLAEERRELVGILAGEAWIERVSVRGRRA